MNPVTRRLLDRIDDPDLADLALTWDALEERIVSIYRAGACSPEDETALQQTRRAAERSYRAWSVALEVHWRAATIDGSPVGEDPFRAVLEAKAPQAVVGNRRLLRRLPAAREALNGLLLERTVE